MSNLRKTVAALLVSSTVAGSSPAAAFLPSLALQSGATPAPQQPRSRQFIRSDFEFCTNRPISAPSDVAPMINACSRALADPPQGNQVAWERQALLLHSKAAWHYVGGQIAESVATLDEADTATADRNSLVHQGSTGLANMLLRALCYAESGRNDEAYALLQAARAIRPYALVIQKSIDRLEIRISGDFDRLPTLTERHLAHDPSAALALFYQHYLNGDLAPAVHFGELAQFGRPTLLGGWRTEEDTNELTRLRDELQFRYLMAYVYAALGDTLASEQAFDLVSVRLEAFVGPEPVADPNRRRVPRHELEEWRSRTLWAAEQRTLATVWRRAVDVRARIASGASLDILDKPASAGVSKLPAANDIMRVVAQIHPELRADIERSLETQRADGLGGLTDLSRFDAVGLLPEPETLGSYPRFGRGGDGVLLAREAGYSQSPVRTGDARTIRFGTYSGSNATADELVMLAAATYAEREGFDSFLVVGRHLLQRTTRITSFYGLHTNDVDSGSEGSLLTVLMDSTAVPPQWEAHRSRLIRVADVMASVGVRQQAIEAAKAAEPRRR